MAGFEDFNDKTVRRLRELAEAMNSGEIIGEKFRAHKVRLNLVPQPYSPELVRTTRECLQVSQSIFAKFLGVSTSAVQQWESGEKSPGRSACRLMDEIRAEPDHWQKRLLSSLEVIS